MFAVTGIYLWDLQVLQYNNCDNFPIKVFLDSFHLDVRVMSPGSNLQKWGMGNSNINSCHFSGYTVRSIYGGGSLYASKFHITQPVAKFIDPWLGDKVSSGIGFSWYRHARLHGWRAGTTTGVDFIPQSGIYEFGYRRRDGPGKNDKLIIEGKKTY